MIDSKPLVAACQRQVSSLELDLRGRVDNEPAVREQFEAEWRSAVAANRTGQTFDAWVGDRLTQIAVAWVLGCVFVRFCEDNGLIEEARIAGAGDKADEAAGNYERYFPANVGHGDREYLKDALEKASALPGLNEVLDEQRNPLWQLDPTADASKVLLAFFRVANPDTGGLVFDFTDEQWDTRFLGDLYQDLSESARDRYALLQTPVFVEEFILDRTLTPAVAAFGLPDVSVIDPTCGSGHFLLGAFDRLIKLWLEREPGTGARVLVQRALDQLAGVDLNPFAIAVARFRMLVASCKVAEVQLLRTAPDFMTHLVAGDSLLFGRRDAIGQTSQLPEMELTLEGKLGPRKLGLLEARRTPTLTAFYYATEDQEALRAILDRRYAVVVGNPPYIVARDKALNDAYRYRFPDSCSGKYSLAAPFMERFFELAVPATDTMPAGYVGQITANSFMKREFGRKLIEKFLPNVDLTFVIDTSGAYIPGHGTPTVILFGRNQPPTISTIRTVMGIRGEPSTPPDAAKGEVWTSICALIDSPGSESHFVSAADVDRSRFATHPWSIGGGGASELKEVLDSRATSTLGAVTDSIGITSFTLEDEVFLLPGHTTRTMNLDAQTLRPMVLGDGLRDWNLEEELLAIFPYDEQFKPSMSFKFSPEAIHLWPWKTNLENNKMFGNQTKIEAGLQWFEYGRLTSNKLRIPLSIAFAFVATHNHFVLDRGGKVFNRSAPVVKLSTGTSIEDHFGLLGLLNSSIACFWLKEMCFPKGGDSMGKEGARVRSTMWEERFEFDSTKLQSFPLPPLPWPITEASLIDDLARKLAEVQPSVIVEGLAPTRSLFDSALGLESTIRAQMISAQEELDWGCLQRYGVINEAHTAAAEGLVAPPLALGERAFEIVLARRVLKGEADPEWFSRHRSTPITTLPTHWSDAYRKLVERRIEMIETNRDVALIERPECKRRWSIEPWAVRERDALRSWLLDRLEAVELWFEGEDPRLLSLARLADRMSTDSEFMSVVRLYSGQSDVRAIEVIGSLVADETVSLQSACRYKDTGLRKRRDWERTWDLQRAEDRGEEVGRIPVPPKYDSKDFLSLSNWKLRGKLDVPKERFVHVAYAERDNDASMVIGWAGWDHLQRAMALSAYLIDRQDRDGWDGARCLPVLVAIHELLPWVRQWHPEVNPMIGEPMGDYLTTFVQETANGLGLTTTDLLNWQPPAASTTRKPRKSKA